MRVKGHLVAIDTPILIHDLSRTGFAVVSEAPFTKGETLEFRLTVVHGPSVRVTACAVHGRPVPKEPKRHLTGFMFIPGKLTGLVPQALIDQVIEAISPHAPCF